MTVGKVTLGLPASLLTRIDRPAKKSRLSQKALRIYAEIGEEDRALADAFLPLAAETLVPSPPRRRKR